MSERPLPLHGVRETLLEPEPAASTAGLADALTAHDEGPRALGRRLRELVSAQPTFLDGWAHLALWALEEGDPVAAYAFARTGYHRGLDRIRRAGWHGQGPVPWHHGPNRGFLRSVHALLRAAAMIGEDDEARRCRDFLLELDPDDALGVRDLDVSALGG
ncbi:MAG: DUF3151 domain-containing protein [Actinomycetota bacterium]|nr:DUF3151 domain-containing protein [Actinomycetota bacterium]